MSIEKGYGNTGDKEGRHRIRRTENQRGELANFTKLSLRRSRPGNQGLDRPNTDFKISTGSSQKWGRLLIRPRQSRPGNQWLDRPNTDFEISSVSNQKGRFDQDIQDTKTNFGNLEWLEVKKDKFASLGNKKTKSS